MDLESLLQENEPLVAYLTEMLATGAVNLVTAAVIIVVGFYAANWLGKIVRRASDRNLRIDATLAAFFSKVVKYAVLVFVFLAVLSRFGIQTTSMVATLGAATLAIGLALQGTLSNVAAGVMIVFFRPYKIGDFVDIAGTSGTVKDVNLFNTELSAVDGVKLIVPNSQSWGRVIMNYSANPTRRVDWSLSISYDDDIDKALQVIRDTLAADARILAEPEPVVVVTGHGVSSIDISARVWAATADHWAIKWDMWKNLKQAFDAHGIEIPYPHQVEIVKGEGVVKPGRKRPPN